MDRPDKELWKVILALDPWRVVLCFLSIICLYVVYYLVLYPCFDQCHEEARWESCGEADATWCEQESSSGDLILYVRAPKWVSDFLMEPVEVTLLNTSDEDPVEEAVVTLELQTSDGARWSSLYHLYVEEDGEREPGNSLTFPEIPPQGYVSRSFRLRVSGEYGERIRANLLLNGDPFEPVFYVDMHVNSICALGLWATRLFLLPPGSNWVIALVASWVASRYLIGEKTERGVGESAEATGGQPDSRLPDGEAASQTDLPSGNETRCAGATDAGAQVSRPS